MRQPVPRAIIWVARLTLLTVLIGGAVTALVLALGVADPPRAGLHAVRVTTNKFVLPTPPYTLEIAVSDAAGRVDTHDFRPAWRIQFTGANSAPVNFSLYADGYFAMPPLVPDSTAFIHIKPTNNQFYLDVHADGTATLRLNHEIAWHGQLPRLSGAELMPQRATLISHIALYEP